ncbi:helix-turn-helix transcriptional regulator [Sphaerotilus sp.]|uniref:helix-turn-helix domain-containing protein n=1 Tax=Sphaerotilus sp. TaxID=2093942 RepID=UPI00286E9D35|nr:helix-turn-helix transcriptional regulator [Sphaerotilus sp.]
MTRHQKTVTPPQTPQGYAPVHFDPAGYAAERAARDPVFKAAHDAAQEEFAALDALLQARLAAGLTQEQVAQRMGVKQSALARVESSLGSRKHAPSLATLRKYAEAVGCRLEIRMVSSA